MSDDATDSFVTTEVERLTGVPRLFNRARDYGHAIDSTVMNDVLATFERYVDDHLSGIEDLIERVEIPRPDASPTPLLTDMIGQADRWGNVGRHHTPTETPKMPHQDMLGNVLPGRNRFNYTPGTNLRAAAAGAASTGPWRHQYTEHYADGSKRRVELAYDQDNGSIEITISTTDSDGYPVSDFVMTRDPGAHASTSITYDDDAGTTTFVHTTYDEDGNPTEMIIRTYQDGELVSEEIATEGLSGLPGADDGVDNDLSRHMRRLFTQGDRTPPRKESALVNPGTADNAASNPFGVVRINLGDDVVINPDPEGKRAVDLNTHFAQLARKLRMGPGPGPLPEKQG